MKKDIQERLHEVTSRNKHISVDHLVQYYDECLSNTLDRRAPLVIKSILIRPKTQWCTDELRTAKQQTGKAERLCEDPN